MPKRIQLRRRAGYRKPAGAITVARPTKWGNPFVDGVRDGQPFVSLMQYGGLCLLILPADHEADPPLDCVEYFTRFVAGEMPELRGMIQITDRAREIRRSLEELRGHDLACWCPLDDRCHADVLLRLANRQT